MNFKSKELEIMRRRSDTIVEMFRNVEFFILTFERYLKFSKLNDLELLHDERNCNQILNFSILHHAPPLLTLICFILFASETFSLKCIREHLRKRFSHENFI